MKYTKPPLTYDQQADQLIQRGLSGDRNLMKDRLASVNYYRLSAYWLPFRNKDDENFKTGTTFETVWNRYVFDRRFRLMVMDAIERIEIAVRTQLAYHHAHKHSAFGYAEDAASLPKLNTTQRSEFFQRVEKEIDRSKESFVAFFRTKYGNEHRYLPVWMVTEIMTFGTILTFYRGCSRNVKKNIASHFGMPIEVFDSWLHTLNAVRNICAHHGRLWNRVLGVKPKIPKSANYPQWHDPVNISNDRMFAILSICHYCLYQVAPQSGWADRIRSLFDEFSQIPLYQMGFPSNWKRCPIWSLGTGS